MYQDYLGPPPVGDNWKESPTIAGGARGVSVGVLGRWLVWRYFRACFVSRFRRPLQVSPVGLSGFWLTSLGTRRRPVAVLDLGVRLVVPWVCVLTAVAAVPLVVLCSLFFLP